MDVYNAIIKVLSHEKDGKDTKSDSLSQFYKVTLIEPIELAHQLSQSQTAAESDPATAALV